MVSLVERAVINGLVTGLGFVAFGLDILDAAYDRFLEGPR